MAGTITITLNLDAGGVDVTPVPAPTQTIVIPRAAPVITNMALSRSGNTLTIDITGFATPREVTSAEISFTPRAGATVQTTNFTVPLTPQFNTYYGNAGNDQFGSTFRLTIPFTVTPDATVITGATVTLVNLLDVRSLAPVRSHSWRFALTGITRHDVFGVYNMTPRVPARGPSARIPFVWPTGSTRSLLPPW